MIKRHFIGHKATFQKEERVTLLIGYATLSVFYYLCRRFRQTTRQGTVFVEKKQ